MLKAHRTRRDPQAHAVHAPGKRLLHRVPLRFVTERATGHGRRSPSASLNLVSFIDFLVVTVIFLLTTFSPAGEASARGVDVPSAENTLDMVDAPMVTVSGGQILVDGVAAGSTRHIEELGRMEKVGPLFDMLKKKRELHTQLEPNRPFPGVCVLAIDLGTPAIVVKSVFQTAAFAGYPNVSFLVKPVGSRPRQ